MSLNNGAAYEKSFDRSCSRYYWDIREVELKMDKDGMHKMMGDMKSMCPMMGKDEKSSKEMDKKELKSSGHEGHH